MVDHTLTAFNSPSLGNVDFSQMVDAVVSYLEKEKKSHFKILVGTDSELINGTSAHFVSAVTVHRVGHGGIYFWGHVTKKNIHSLRQRMYEEVTYSLTLATHLVDEFKKRDLPLDKILEIHVDVGQNGESREVLNEVVGMVKGSGFACQTKPNAFAASNVADKYT